MAMFSRGTGAHRFSELLRKAHGKGAHMPQNNAQPGAKPEKGGSGPHGRGGEGPARKPARETRKLPAHEMGKDQATGKHPGHTAHHRGGAGSSGKSPMHSGISTQANFGNPPGHQTFEGNPHFADSGADETLHSPRQEPVRLGMHGTPPGHMRKPMADHTQVNRGGAKHPPFRKGYPNTPAGTHKAKARRGHGFGGRGRRMDLAGHL